MSVRPKLFRDPVHDIISFRPESPEGRVLLGLIESPEIQRLRRIRQLGLTNFVYHGAEHSRFVHSMGVSVLAGRMYDQVRPNGDVGERLAVVAAALCHDLGHGPFSHVAERIGSFHHEDVTRAIITRHDTQVHQVLSSYDRALPGRVSALYGARNSDKCLRQLVSSQLDADRIDYILRDGLATGVKIGVFDVERILSTLEIHEGWICASFRAVEAVEGYLLARFHMYKQVYLHKTSRSAERMLEAAFRRARELRATGKGPDWECRGPFAHLVDGCIDGPRDIPLLDDMDVWFALKQWAGDTDPILAELAGGLVHRRLFKTRAIPMGAEGDALLRSAWECAGRLGLHPDYHVLEDSSEDTPYSPYIPGKSTPDEAIRILCADGRVVPIEAVSDIVRLLGQVRYQVRRLIAPAAVMAKLGS